VTWGEAAREGRWTDWPGLPARLDRATRARELRLPGGDHEPEPAMLGRRRRRAVDLGRARYWLNGDGVGANVDLVELVEPPSSRPPAELLAALGPPEREGPGRHRRADAMTTEYVYPSRGLALTVAESFDDPETFEPFLAQVLLFPPTDLRSYVLELGGDDRGGPKL
jgi:hypothetical protein